MKLKLIKKLFTYTTIYTLIGVNYPQIKICAMDPLVYTTQDTVSNNNQMPNNNYNNFNNNVMNHDNINQDIQFLYDKLTELTNIIKNNENRIKDLEYENTTLKNKLKTFYDKEKTMSDYQINRIKQLNEKIKILDEFIIPEAIKYFQDKIETLKSSYKKLNTNSETILLNMRNISNLSNISTESKNNIINIKNRIIYENKLQNENMVNLKDESKRIQKNIENDIEKFGNNWLKKLSELSNDVNKAALSHVDDIKGIAELKASNDDMLKQINKIKTKIADIAKLLDNVKHTDKLNDVFKEIRNRFNEIADQNQSKDTHEKEIFRKGVKNISEKDIFNDSIFVKDVENINNIPQIDGPIIED